MAKSGKVRIRPRKNEVASNKSQTVRKRDEAGSQDTASVDPAIVDRKTEKAAPRKRRRPPPRQGAKEQTDLSTRQNSDSGDNTQASQARANGSQEYEVGHGKPPVSTRFKKGKSGNPRGRPKQSKNIAIITREEMRRLLPIVENGKTRRRPAVQLAIRKLVLDSISGKPHAVRAILEAAERHLNQEETTSAPILDEADKKLLEEFLGPLTVPHEDTQQSQNDQED